MLAFHHVPAGDLARSALPDAPVRDEPGALAPAAVERAPRPGRLDLRPRAIGALARLLARLGRAQLGLARRLDPEAF